MEQMIIYKRKGRLQRVDLDCGNYWVARANTAVKKFGNG